MLTELCLAFWAENSAPCQQGRHENIFHPISTTAVAYSGTWGGWTVFVFGLHEKDRHFGRLALSRQPIGQRPTKAFDIIEMRDNYDIPQCYRKGRNFDTVQKLRRFSVIGRSRRRGKTTGRLPVVQ
jgi:hypothetical protein